MSFTSITSPVDFVDISIPSTGELFRLSGVGILFDGDDYLTYKLSSDGGASFYGESPFDYRSTLKYNNQNGEQLEFQRDSVGFLAPKASTAWNGADGQNPNNWCGSILDVLIDPGAANRFPVMLAQITHEPGVVAPGHGSSSSWLSMEAPSRVNLIRIGPYFGDGKKLVRGMFALTEIQ